MRSVGLALLAILLFGVNLSILWKRRKENTDEEEKEMPEGWMKEKSYRLVWIAGSILLAFLGGYLGLERELQSILPQIRRVVLMTVLAAAAVVDFREKMIPNQLILAGLGYRIAIWLGELVWGRETLLEELVSQLVGAIGIFLVCMLFLLVMKDSIGMGDIKLFMIMGLYLGLYGMGSAIMTSLILIFIYAVFLLITRKKGKKDVLPFAPAVFLGTYLSMILGGI